MKVLMLNKQIWGISHYLAIEGIAILFMALFGLTAVDKLIHFERFYTELGKSPFLAPYALAVAWGTPTIELVVTLILGINRWRLLGLYISVFLMSLFSAYIYLLLNYSYYTPCLCSAVLENLSWEEHLVFNLVFLALAIIGVILKEKSLSTKKIRS
jgi:hypothetical protein